MKITPMTVDYTDDIYTMCEYLIKNEVSPEHAETKVGRFSLGRATGHSRSIESAVERLEAKQINTLVVYPTNSHMNIAVKQNQGNKNGITTYCRLSADMFRGYCHRDIPDIIIFDNFSSLELFGEFGLLDVHKLYYEFLQYHRKSVAFMIVQ